MAEYEVTGVRYQMGDGLTMEERTREHGCEDRYDRLSFGYGRITQRNRPYCVKRLSPLPLPFREGEGGRQMEIKSKDWAGLIMNYELF